MGRGWAKYRDLSVASKSIICRSRTCHFSRQSDRQKEKSVVSITYVDEQNVVCSQTQLDDIAHEQTIICKQSRGGLSANE